MHFKIVTLNKKKLKCFSVERLSVEEVTAKYRDFPAQRKNIIEELIYSRDLLARDKIYSLIKCDPSVEGSIREKIIKIGKDDYFKAEAMALRLFDCSYLEWLDIDLTEDQKVSLRERIRNDISDEASESSYYK